MNTKNYIKVTIEGHSYVVLAGNENYYRSQKASIETPTEAEVLAAFPELAPIKEQEDNAAAIEQLRAKLKNAEKDRDTAIRKAAEWREQLDATKSALAEAEALLKKQTKN